MEHSEQMSSTGQGGEKRLRGRGRGSNFFVLARAALDELWEIPTANRLYLTMSFLVLLAGTGSDHRLTKWSAKAIEDHVGIGKPRARRAIEELIAGGLIQRTESSTAMSPQYEILILPDEDDPIFLPSQLINGLKDETPILRRLREAGDLMALRMLLELYGQVQTDATYAVSSENVWMKCQTGEKSARKLGEIGAHAVWGLTLGHARGGRGAWVSIHHKPKDEDPWAAFWESFRLLEQVGAIWFEPWVFDGDDDDSEPLFPVDPAAMYNFDVGGDEARLTTLAFEACSALLGDRVEVLDRYPLDCVVPFPVHHKAPSLRGVLRLRVEADTPGRRLAFVRRKALIEAYERRFRAVEAQASKGEFQKPLMAINVRSKANG